MEYSNEWLQLRKAENEYFTCRFNFMQNKEAMVSDLTKAVATIDDREAAFRFLWEMEPEVAIVAPLLARVADLAIDSSNLNTIGLTREVLYKYKSEPEVRSMIQTIATAYLPQNDDWNYRRIAELYDLLGYQKELASLLELCQANANWEIREIAEDYEAGN